MFKNKKNLLLVGVLLVGVFMVIFIKGKNNSQPQIQSVQATPQTNDGKIYADLKGDGNKDSIILTQNIDGSFKSLIAYNPAGKEIGSKPDEIIIPLPAISEETKVYKLDAKGREIVAFNFIAGPHQRNTMFFGLTVSNTNILPICHVAVPASAYDCLFYSDDPGLLLVKDLDGDGNLEIAEVVDEYPANGILDSTAEDAISKAASSEGLTADQEASMRRIAMREQGGRGRNVIWAIYSYNGNYFVPQTGADYDKYYNLIGDSVANKMKVAELSADSLSYINFVRAFWQK